MENHQRTVRKKNIYGKITRELLKQYMDKSQKNCQHNLWKIIRELLKQCMENHWRTIKTIYGKSPENC